MKGLPNLIIIGGQKCATSWLRARLNTHPDIFMAKKQIHFFDRYYSRGVGWYKSHFEVAGPHAYLGEKTTEYSDKASAPMVAARMSESLEGVKVIYLMRDPVERAWSSMLHCVRSGIIELPSDPQRAVFETHKLLSDGAGYEFLSGGEYGSILSTFRSKLGEENVFPMIFEEDVVVDPHGGWAGVLSFLGLKETPLVIPQKAENSWKLSQQACNLNRRFRRIPYARALIRRLDNALDRSPWEPKMAPQTYRRLSEYYQSHNESLFRLLDREVACWGSQNKGVVK